jgi:hypothetical protein
LKRADDDTWFSEWRFFRSGGKRYPDLKRSGRFCEAEVQQFRARRSQHDIARLQVAMYYAASVCLIQSVRDLDPEFENLLDWNGPSLQTI